MSAPPSSAGGGVLPGTRHGPQPRCPRSSTAQSPPGGGRGVGAGGVWLTHFVGESSIEEIRAPPDFGGQPLVDCWSRTSEPWLWGARVLRPRSVSCGSWLCCRRTVSGSGSGSSYSGSSSRSRSLSRLSFPRPVPQLLPAVRVQETPQRPPRCTRPRTWAGPAARQSLGKKDEQAEAAGGWPTEKI